LSGFLIVNPRSGDHRPTPEELCTEARARGLSVHLLTPSDDLEALARETPADAIGIAGGDGSLGVVARVAIERDLPFVCIPFGTRNHFARDLGLDRDDPVAMLSAFDGAERRIDVARAGDRTFLNNASLGLYARLVHRRERHRRRRAVLARLRALALSARERRPLDLVIDGEPVSVRALVVGNNAYTLDLFDLGSRESLDEGLLHVYVAEGLLPTSWTEAPPRMESVMESAHPLLTVALDGEPVELATPIRFAIEPRALRVLVP
jgi:diacylglycerol kinase family enzyme